MQHPAATEPPYTSHVCYEKSPTVKNSAWDLTQYNAISFWAFCRSQFDEAIVSAKHPFHVLSCFVILITKPRRFPSIQICARQKSKIFGLAAHSACIGTIRRHVFKYASLHRLQFIIRTDEPSRRGMLLERQAVPVMERRTHLAGP